MNWNERVIITTEETVQLNIFACSSPTITNVGTVEISLRHNHIRFDSWKIEWFWPKKNERIHIHRIGSLSCLRNQFLLYCSGDCLFAFQFVKSSKQVNGWQRRVIPKANRRTLEQHEQQQHTIARLREMETKGAKVHYDNIVIKLEKTTDICQQRYDKGCKDLIWHTYTHTYTRTCTRTHTFALRLSKADLGIHI